MSYDDQPMKRKIKEGLNMAQMEASNAASLGMETLAKIREQGSRFSKINDDLSPLASMSDESDSTMNMILRDLTSGKRLFYILAAVTVIVLFLVLRWKRS